MKETTEYTVECELPCTFHTVVRAGSPEAAIAKARKTFNREEWWLNEHAVSPTARRTKFRVSA